MTAIRKYQRFSWCDFEKLDSDPEDLLERLGLNNFPHLILMLLTSIDIITQERDRKSAIESTGPYLLQQVRDINTLKNMISTLESLNASYNNFLHRSLIETIAKQKSFSVVKLILDKKSKINSGIALEHTFQFNVDKYDIMALLVLRNFDLAYERFQGSDFNNAIIHYATAWELYQNMAKTLVIPEFTPLKIGEEIGIKKESERRSFKGGKGYQETAINERASIKPSVYQAMAKLNSVELKNTASTYRALFNPLSEQMSTCPPNGLKSGFKLKNKVLLDVIKNIFHDIQSKVQERDGHENKVELFVYFREEAKLLAQRVSSNDIAS